MMSACQVRPSISDESFVKPGGRSVAVNAPRQLRVWKARQMLLDIARQYETLATMTDRVRRE
jgi:hypothetical protein